MKCERCEGKGEIADNNFTADDIELTTITCPDCNGTGEEKISKLEI